MLRAFFVALGIYFCIVGVECMLVEKTVFVTHGDPAPGSLTESVGRAREVIVPDWVPWSLMSAGAVTMLYTVTVPKRVAG
ncbi:MAG: hypothetical protein ACYC35_15675 [Pirellulales bacterium]|jgi:hypothetical protein